MEHRDLSEFDMEQCREQAADWFITLREGQATQAQVSAWLTWVRADSRNLAAFEAVSQLADSLSSLPRETKAKLNHELSAPHLTASSSRPVMWHRRAGYAALAAALVVLMVGAYYLFSPARRVFAGNGVYVTARAQSRTLILEDGTRVTLGASSLLAVNYSPGQRTIALRSGEVYLHVKHDPRWPFVVNVGGLRVTDIGTAFDVRKTGSYVTVDVEQGQVELIYALSGGRKIPPAGLGLKPLQLVGGQGANFDTGSAPVVTSIDAPEVASWRKGRLRFRDAPLSVVIANVNRYSPDQIVIADPRIGNMHYTGTVYVNQVGEWLEAVRSVFHLQERHSDDGRRVTLSLSDLHSSASR